MTQEEKNLIEQTAKANDNKEQIIQAKFNIAGNYLILARLLKENRDNAYWKLEGCDTFDEFLGQPEVSFSRSKAYSLIRIWELYKDRLHLDDHTLLDIGNAKLALIAPVVESDREGWLAKAKHLSKSDLKIELGQGPGTSRFSSPPAPASVLPPDAPCAICGEKPTEKSHFPCSRGASTPEDHWVPMCRECHQDFHARPKDFTWDFKRKWADYFYERINRCD